MPSVLVIEDEARIASFVEKGLRAHGYGVVWVRGGREGLDRAAREDVSLVILDLGLPDMDGLEVLKRLRERGNTVPVLVLSARARVSDRVKGLNLGADDYLVKPFAFEELLARVRANLRPRGPVAVSALLHAGAVPAPQAWRSHHRDGARGRVPPQGGLRRVKIKPIIPNGARLLPFACR